MYPYQFSNAIDRQLTWLDAAFQVLADAKKPLNSEEIVSEIKRRNLRLNMGPYPHVSVASAINTSIFLQGDSSPFRRVGRDKFEAVRDSGVTNHVQDPQDFQQTGLAVSTIFEVCGLNWMRNKILWCESPVIQGQDLCGNIKNYAKSSGIYALFDGADLVFVGWADSENLGNRLYGHTTDYLAARWDAFSWFGTNSPVFYINQASERVGLHRSAFQEIATVVMEFASPCFNGRSSEKPSAIPELKQIGDIALEPDEEELQSRFDRRKRLQVALDEIPCLEDDSEGLTESLQVVNVVDSDSVVDNTTPAVDTNLPVPDVRTPPSGTLNEGPSRQAMIVEEGSVVTYCRMDTNVEHTIRLRHIVNSQMIAVDQRNAMSRADVGSPLFRAFIGRQVGDECEVEIIDKNRVVVSTYEARILAIIPYEDYLGRSH